MNNTQYVAKNYRAYTQHDWTKPYSPECIKPGCREKPYWDGKVYYSLCLGCLEEQSLGPFRKRIHKEGYSTAFWLTDWERSSSKQIIH